MREQGSRPADGGGAGESKHAYAMGGGQTSGGIAGGLVQIADGAMAAPEAPTLRNYRAARQ